MYDVIRDTAREYTIQFVTLYVLSYCTCVIVMLISVFVCISCYVGIIEVKIQININRIQLTFKQSQGISESVNLCNRKTNLMIKY